MLKIFDRAKELIITLEMRAILNKGIDDLTCTLAWYISLLDEYKPGEMRVIDRVSKKQFHFTYDELELKMQRCQMRIDILNKMLDGERITPAEKALLQQMPNLKKCAIINDFPLLEVPLTRR